MGIEIKIVGFNSPLYNQAVALREKLLRIPLGMRFTQDYLLQDKNNVHIVALQEAKVVGTVLVKPIDAKTVKIRQVATDYSVQGKGIGKKLMLFAEDYARSRGFERVILHARYYVVDFYKKLGYSVIGDEFVEVAMPHRLMVKKL